MTPETRNPVRRRWQMPDWVVWLIALVGPALLTAALLGITGAEKRNYVFLYLGLIAAVGVARGRCITAPILYRFRRLVSLMGPRRLPSLYESLIRDRRVGPGTGWAST
jgi:hypothetical protein